MPGRERSALPGGYAALTAESLARDVQRICQLGNRFVGTPGEARARKFMVAEMREAGLERVRLEPVPVVAYELQDATCAVDGSDLRVPTAGLQFTASADAKGPAAYIGSPQSTDDVRLAAQEHGSLEGKVAVLHSFWPWGLCEALVAEKVCAIVVISESPPDTLMHLTGQHYPAASGAAVTESPLPVPGVTIEAEAGRRLLALLSARPRVLRVRHRASYRQTTSANVVGENSPDQVERVIIGAHYDTQLEGVGAHDNATGLAALLGIARGVAGRQHRRAITFVAFCEEEHGLRGATGYCTQHASELDDIAAMVNLDALAWACPGTRTLSADPAIADYAARRASEVGWPPENVRDASLLPGADLNPFVDAGVPSCWFWRFPPQHLHYHSAGDVAKLLDMEAVADVANASAHTVHCLASDASLPFGRSRPTVRWQDLRPLGVGASE